MNFFESQDAAKRNTGKLIFLFALAVISLILVTNLMVMFIFGVFSSEMTSMAASNSISLRWEIFAAVGVGVALVILVGSLYKIAALSGGGSRIAEMMDGRLLVSGSDDFKERRLLNVVEEMAIASGTPVPPVYVMEEKGINAFAAGYSPSDAVIGVSRGALNTLSREQLQGVIAHEFSHILHGDMRINIRLIGVLHGIMVLGIIGYHLLRSGSRSRRSKDSGGIVALGLGLVVVGYVGTFFGNLIKAAVSRQREYLADASAVQFTRNPEGIAGALMQIGQHSEKSYLQHPGSNEISHALFEEGSVMAMSRLYATHPPLEERIGAILPNWDGSYDLIAGAAVTEAEDAQQSASTHDLSDGQRLTAAIVGGAALAEQMLGQIGNPGTDQLGYANNLLHQVPEPLLAAAREPSGARALIYLLLSSEDDATREAQLTLLQNSADTGVYEELRGLLDLGLSVQAELRLPLVEIAIGSLRQLSKEQYELFKANFDALIKLDNKVNLFEWSLQKFLFHHLQAVFDKSHKPRLGKKNLEKMNESISELLSVVAQSTRQANGDAADAFSSGASLLKNQLQFVPVAKISVESLNQTLDRLNEVRPLQKPVLLKALLACAEADGQILPREVELIRAIAAALDCPTPPILTPQN